MRRGVMVSHLSGAEPGHDLRVMRAGGSGEGAAAGDQLAFEDDAFMAIERMLDAVLQIARFARQLALYLVLAARGVAVARTWNEIDHLADRKFMTDHKVAFRETR